MGIGVVLPRVITPNLKRPRDAGYQPPQGSGIGPNAEQAKTAPPNPNPNKFDPRTNTGGPNPATATPIPYVSPEQKAANEQAVIDKRAIDNYVRLTGAQFAMQDANDAERLANANAMARAQHSASGADTSGQRERNALSIWGNELDRQQVEKLWGLNQQKFAADNTYYGDLLKRTGEQYGMNEATRNNANMAVSNQLVKDMRTTKSDATARGATTSAGVKSAYGDLAAQAKVGYATNSITFNKAKNAIDDQMATYRKRQEDLGFGHMNDTELMLKALQDNALNRKTLDSLGRSIGVGSGQSAALLAATIAANNSSFLAGSIQNQIDRTAALYGQGIDTYGMGKPPDVTSFSPLRQPPRP